MSTVATPEKGKRKETSPRPQTGRPSTPPPSYTEAVHQGRPENAHKLRPLDLVLEGESICDQSTGRILYKLSRPVTSLPKPGSKSPSSSVTFERVEDDNIADNPKQDTQPELQHKHLFYLVHPADAQYRNDVPPYYITCRDAEPTQGNMKLETQESRFQKAEFTALLSPDRTWAHKPLFAEAGEQVPLFTARRAGFMSSRYTWRDSEGNEVGYDYDKNGEGHGLVITRPMAQEKRDALVALWVLRVWYSVAESRQAKRDALERMLPAPAVSDHGMMLTKRVGGLGALAGAGGGGC